MTTKQAAQLFVSCFIAFSQVVGATAADIVFDNFDDGNIRDQTPTSWTSLSAPDVADASSGDLLIKESECCSGLIAPDVIVGDVSIRVHGRIVSGTLGVGTKFRADDSGYFTSVDSLGVMYTSVQVDQVSYDVASVPLTIHHDEDIFLQMDVVGNKIFSWYWPVSSERPAAPQLTLELLGHPLADDGRAGVWLADNSESVLRFIQIADAPIPVPEPSTVILGLIGLGCLARRPR